MINLLLLAIGGLYYPQKAEEFDNPSSDFYIIVLVLFAYCGFVFVAILHIHIRFPQILPTLKKTAKKCYKCRCCKKKKEKLEYDNYSVSSEIDEIPKASFSELRESILESGFTLAPYTD